MKDDKEDAAGVAADKGSEGAHRLRAVALQGEPLQPTGVPHSSFGIVLRV